jgi:hypothetical protein
MQIPLYFFSIQNLSRFYKIDNMALLLFNEPCVFIILWQFLSSNKIQNRVEFEFEKRKKKNQKRKRRKIERNPSLSLGSAHFLPSPLSLGERPKWPKQQTHPSPRFPPGGFSRNRLRPVHRSRSLAHARPLDGAAGQDELRHPPAA